MDDGESRLAVGVATISDPGLLSSCVAGLREQRGLVLSRDVMVTCNSDRVRVACRDLRAEIWQLFDGGTNWGTCKSWNVMISNGLLIGDAVLILGDDVRITEPEGISKIKIAVESDPTILWFIGGLGFSGFVMTRHVWDRVGKFDEGIWPAYFEDNDYHRRANLLGIESRDVVVRFTHVGSGSLRRWKEWEVWNAMVAFPINATRYMLKWGGTPGKETFSIPWDGKLEGKTAKQMIRERGIAPPWGWD